MIRITKKQVLMLHKQLIDEYGGSHDVRDESLLESALETPFQSFGGEGLYPSVQAKAARLCYGLVKNHSMMDGNKRIGAHAMLVFLFPLHNLKAACLSMLPETLCIRGMTESRWFLLPPD